MTAVQSWLLRCCKNNNKKSFTDESQNILNQPRKKPESQHTSTHHNDLGWQTSGRPVVSNGTQQHCIWNLCVSITPGKSSATANQRFVWASRPQIVKIYYNYRPKWSNQLHQAINEHHEVMEGCWHKGLSIASLHLFVKIMWGKQQLNLNYWDIFDQCWR